MAGSNDPTAFLRDLFGEWQKFSGGASAGEGEAQGGGSGGGPGGGPGGMPPAFRMMAERALGAANMPSKADLESLSARIGRMEAALFRIEAALADLAKPPATDATTDPAS